MRNTERERQLKLWNPAMKKLETTNKPVNMADLKSRIQGGSTELREWKALQNSTVGGKKLMKQLVAEFRDGDLSDITLDERYPDNRRYIKSEARSALKVLEPVMLLQGIFNLKEFFAKHSVETVFRNTYGLGLVKLSGLCIFMSIFGVPYYLTDVDKENGKTFRLTGVIPKRTKNAPTKNGKTINRLKKEVEELEEDK